MALINGQWRWNKNELTRLHKIPSIEKNFICFFSIQLLSFYRKTLTGCVWTAVNRTLTNNIRICTMNRSSWTWTLNICLSLATRPQNFTIFIITIARCQWRRMKCEYPNCIPCVNVLTNVWKHENGLFWYVRFIIMIIRCRFQCEHLRHTFN